MTQRDNRFKMKPPEGDLERSLRERQDELRGRPLNWREKLAEEFEPCDYWLMVAAVAFFVISIWSR